MANNRPSTPTITLSPAEPASSSHGLATARVPAPRQGSLPRSPGQRGRKRKALPPPPPPSLITQIKSSPYFVPSLIALFSLVALLLYSAIRIASSSSEATIRFAEEPSASPKEHTSTSVGGASAPLSTSSVEDVKARAKHLERTWELEAEQVRQRDLRVNEKPEVVGMNDQELQDARERFAETKRAMEAYSADELTQILHDMNNV